MTSRPEARNERPEARGQRPEGFAAGHRALLLLCLLIPEVVRAQALPPASGTPGVAGEVRTVAGRVTTGSGDDARVVSGQMVVLHRIAADSSGPVDSIRTSASGAYRFRYTLESPRSMYIVSTRYSSVAYFTAPLRERVVTSPDADVSVFDTTSVEFPLTVRGRHVVIAPPEAEGVRRVVDVFEVANDSNQTLVAGATGRTWSVTLPSNARDISSSGGDLPPEAFRVGDGKAELVVPFPPGMRQIVLTYAIPVERAVTIPVSESVASLEVLVEGEGAITGAGLAAEEPVSLEGRSFQRFRSASVPAGASFRLEGAAAGGRADRLALLAVALVAVALGIVIARRAPRETVPVLATRPASETLAREIAALDHVYATPERRAGPAAEHYQARRAALMGQLVEAQAVEDRNAVT